MINKIGVVSQVIRKRSLLSSKGSLSVASKICIQMNTKTGDAPWTIYNANDNINKRKIMYCGISFSKGPKGFTLGFVGTISKDFTELHSDSKCRIQAKEQVPVNVFETIFIEWAKKYYQNNKKTLPDTIVIYR